MSDTKKENPIFFTPGLSKKFRIFDKDSALQPNYVPRAKLLFIVASENPAHKRLLHGFVTKYRDYKSAKYCVELPSFPAVVENFSFKGRLPKCAGQVLTTGASALRVRTKLTKDLGEERATSVILSEAEYARERVSQTIPTIEDEDLICKSDLPFVIECRNFYNYYHFTTESLIYLQMYRDYAFSGEIHLITAGASEVKEYLRRAVEDFYPDLFDRIHFKTGNAKYKKAIIPFTSNHLYHFSNEDLIEDIEEKAEFSNSLRNGELRPATNENYRMIFRNSRDEYIRRHRDNVLRRAYTYRGAKYVYVSRKQGASRDRSIIEEDKIIEMVGRYGFDMVHFEEITPLQQASLCNSVDIFLSAHGAGFANMTYGKPGSHFIELSHLQTARHRFGDFNMHASASGVNYTHFFADHSIGDSDEVPNLHHEGHAGIALSHLGLQKLEYLIASLIDKEYQKKYLARLRGLRAKGEDQAAVSLILNDSLRSAVCPVSLTILAEAYEKMESHRNALKAYVQLASLVPYRGDILMKIIDLANFLSDEAIVTWAKEMSEVYKRTRWMRWCRAEGGAIEIQG